MELTVQSSLTEFTVELIEIPIFGIYNSKPSEVIEEIL